MKRTILRIAAVTVLTAILLYFFGRSVVWSEVPAQIADVNFPLFLVFVLLAALHFLTRALRWQVLIAREKLNVRFRNLVAANVVGFTVSAIFPGRLGELAKPLYLARREGLRPGFAIGTVVVERIFDLFTMCFLLGRFLLGRPLFATAWPVPAEAGASLMSWGKAGVVLAAALVGAGTGGGAKQAVARARGLFMGPGVRSPLRRARRARRDDGDRDRAEAARSVAQRRTLPAAGAGALRRP